MANGKGQAVRGADFSNEKSLVGGVFPSQHQAATQLQDVGPQQAIAHGEVLGAPEYGDLVSGKNEKYQKLLAPQDKSYKQKQLFPESTPDAAPDAPVVLQSNPAPEPAAVLSQGK